MQKAVRDELERIASEMVIAMKMACPRDSGELADSIGWTWGKAPEGSVGVTTVGQGDFALTIYAGSGRTMVQNSRGIQFRRPN